MRISSGEEGSASGHEMSGVYDATGRRETPRAARIVRQSKHEHGKQLGREAPRARCQWQIPRIHFAERFGETSECGGEQSRLRERVFRFGRGLFPGRREDRFRV